MTVDEVREKLEGVPGDYECTILLESQDLETVEVNDAEKIVDFGY